jgi:DNA-binding MurR/RpiR family transcriptional regulator
MVSDEPTRLRSRRVRTELIAHMASLSPSERKVARALLADYPAAGLGSAATLAKAAGTSTPTVLRLVSRIGLPGYPELQTLLREEVSLESASPLRRAQTHGEDDSDFWAIVRERARLIRRVIETVPAAEFERAVDAFATTTKPVLVCGGYFSQMSAHLFALQLDQLIGCAMFTQQPLGRDAGRYLGLTKGQIVVIFDLRRYEHAAEQIASLAASRGARIVLVTDEYLSPTAKLADIVLPVPVGGIPFDSFAGVTVLIEALVEGVFRALGDQAIERMRHWEETVQITRALRSGELSQLEAG